LKGQGADVSYFDPHIPVIRPSREHSHWAGTKSMKWNHKIISSFDAVLVSTAHDAVNYKNLADWAQLIVDTRNVMAKIKTRARAVNDKVWKA
jgi:UDP-N-acetyl-D-glucosamine dehydrogenase